MKFAKLPESAYYALWGLEVPKSQVSTNSTPYVSSELDRTKHTTFSPAPNTLPSPKYLPTVHPSPANTYNSQNRKSANNSYIPTPYIRPSYSPTTTNLNAKPTPFKQLSKQDYDEKRRNNQCFYCSEKYTPGHKCKTGKLYMLLCPELGDSENVTTSSKDDVFSKDNISTDSFGDLSLSIHALIGSWGIQTLCVHGVIKKQLVKIFTGLNLSIHYMLHQVTWKLQGVEFVGDFFVMPLGGYNVVLGVAWLSTLGDIRCNFNKLYMEFIWKGQRMKLEGSKQKLLEWEGNEKLVAGHQFQQAYLIDWCNLKLSCCSLKLELPQWLDSHKPKKQELSDLLESFADIFASPTTLPPPRILDHGITIKEGNDPVNLKAYRYGALQKNVIEEMVKEMLDSGVIKPSQSEYAPPVVLVKKKDGSWRFYVDYRRLNHLTVKNQFPIPIVEELLDELHGACYFSKLDLKSGYHQVRMREADIGKTAFRTHEGLYEFVVMPFGLSNAPATFQNLMNWIFKAYLRKFVLVFFDDVLVYSLIV
ncbi:retrovirus-related pol polyprotein from transposon 17.6 [Tanacetum coccineum]